MPTQPDIKTHSFPQRLMTPADGQKVVKLDFAVPTFSVTIEIDGQLNVSSGTTGDQVVRPEAIERLYDVELRVEGPFGNEHLVKRMNLRTLLKMHALNVSSFPAVTQPSQSNLNAQSTADFLLRLRLWGSPRVLYQPQQNFWPAFDGQMAPQARSMKLVFRPDTSTVNSDSDQGTGAILSAGSDTIVFSEGPNVRVEQHIAPNHKGPRDGEAGRPFWYPRYVQDRTDTFNAADERLGEEINQENRIAMLLIRHEEGNGRDPVGLDTGRWNDLSIKATDFQIFDERALSLLHEQAADEFDSYDRDAGNDGSNYDGYLPVLLAPGGRGNGAWRPKDFNNSRLEFDVADPSTDPGAFTHLAMQLKTL